ncbi:alpha/beta hydrolase [Paroceanicella profunda]|uniref:Alpha/beta hydrolase n=1 Tax=Paroceanicella profunda TaxID=2579971 RepID=A0A5B8FQ17_9RHOB|nr:alpha/beta hydrolase [Paroceanicella profunda]QDL90425.1 alpha/beta hydrolase [Paroceanicella profunda]
MPRITAPDETRLSCKHRGAGTPGVFNHGRPLNAEARTMCFADRGYRAIVGDRRGHGRSDQPRGGTGMVTCAGDLATPILHGDDVQAVPVDTPAREAAALVPDAGLKACPGGAHGHAGTHRDAVDADPPACVRA